MTEKRLVSELRLDGRNPRLPDEIFENDEDAIKELVASADLEELVQSIGNAGWLDFEPPIVEQDTNVVVEGNRRLAALRVLADPALAKRVGIVLPSPLHIGATPAEIEVNVVSDRKAARDFIGFKHVNGAQRWDSYAKARFATEWLDEGDDISDVSRRLGDNHNTVGRLVNGIRVLDQAESSKRFDRSRMLNKRFYFSHLYTALHTTAARAFLGLDDPSDQVLSDNPVPKESLSQLEELMTWIYGQDQTPAVVKTQNPDLTRLVRVLASEKGLRQLRATANLGRAFEEVEDKAKVFREAFFKTQDAVAHVVRLGGRYDPQDELLDDANELLHQVNTLVRSMRAMHSEEL